MDGSMEGFYAVLSLGAKAEEYYLNPFSSVSRLGGVAFCETTKCTDRCCYQYGLLLMSYLAG